jgi:hypothetical protein
MTLVARKTDLVNTGHSCDNITQLNTTQGSVYAENQLIARLGDPTVSHDVPTVIQTGTDEEGNPIFSTVCLPHVGIVKSANGTVYAVNKLVTRINENCDAGTIISSASTVHAE